VRQCQEGAGARAAGGDRGWRQKSSPRARGVGGVPETKSRPGRMAYDSRLSWPPSTLLRDPLAPMWARARARVCVCVCVCVKQREDARAWACGSPTSHARKYADGLSMGREARKAQWSHRR
jgi:hypothetical protein